VEDYNKVAEYFVSVLGGCISVISKKADLNVKLLNDKCAIVKTFGEDNLYSYDLKPLYFKTSMLQFICGKEYTFVLEININEKNINVGDELLEVEFIYEDIIQKTKKDKIIKYKYELKDVQFTKANEEYIRSQVYLVLEEALKLRDKNENEKAKKILKDMEVWLNKNYHGENKSYLDDIKKTQQFFVDESDSISWGMSYVTSQIREKQTKRLGSNMIYTNSVQNHFGKTVKLRSNNNP
jgi:ribosomal protein L21